MPTLSFEQVYQHARAAGFSEAQAVIATAIAAAESGLNTTILGDRTITTGKWGPSVGLWQVRSLTPGHLARAAGADRYRNAPRLRDSSYNAAAAYAISGRGSNWRPWSVFTSGAYRKHLARARQAAKRVEQGVRDVLPVEGGGRISARYGQKGRLWSGGTHTGVDYAAATGTPVRSTVSGTVVAQGASGGAYGTRVMIAGPGGYQHLYAHLSAESVDEGQKVKAGQVIGKVGATGKATGAHLHYEVRDKSGQHIDPATVKFSGVGILDVIPDWVPGDDKIKQLDDLDDHAEAAAGLTADALRAGAGAFWGFAGDVILKGVFVVGGLVVVGIGLSRMTQRSPTAAQVVQAPKRAGRAVRTGATLAATRGASKGAGAAKGAKAGGAAAATPKPAAKVPAQPKQQRPAAKPAVPVDDEKPPF